jgi:4-hydroxyacetophenone monooxygenase
MISIEPPVSDLDDAALRAGVAVANVPVLLLLLYQITGDGRWLEDPYRPRRNDGLDDNSTGGFSPEIQDEIRAAAFAAIGRYRDGVPLAIPDPDPAQLVYMLSVSMGERVPAEYGPMMATELTAADDPVRDVKPPAGFRVLIIGGGLSGIAMGAGLARAGIDFTVLERAHDVGGTWLRHTYPGAGVDTPSSIYSFSFAARPWSRYFALRDEVEQYLRESARDTGMYSHIRFGEEVVSARYAQSRAEWVVETRDDDGGPHRYVANFVISAVGAFTRAKMPDIAGLDSFTGERAHTADWPEHLDLRGKRVAVIGNGASAMQVVPAIADNVSRLTVFQRVPHWIAPFPKFGQQVPQQLRRLVEAVPLYRIWDRIRWGWTFNDRLYDSLQKDPQWPHPERAVNAINDRHRAFFTRYLENELDGRPDLIEALTPSYPPFGKRILLDNGWFRTLRRDNVELVSERVARVDGPTLVAESGRRFDVDVLICATGFDVVNFLAPMDVRGRSGRTIRDVWGGDDARAYLGMTVPDFPNFAMLYGPNVQPGHGGSLVTLAEIEVHYVLDLLAKMFRGGLASAECDPEVYRRYNQRVDEAHERMIWTHPGMSTYYRNSLGRVVVPGPFRNVDLWHMAREANLGDFITVPQRGSAGRPARSLTGDSA